MRKLKITELNRISEEEFKHTEKMPLVVILDNHEILLNHSVEEITRKFDFGADFERLFNAVIADKAKFKQLFNQ